MMSRFLAPVRLAMIMFLSLGMTAAASWAAKPPGGTTTCDLTQLQLRDSTVNQGLGSYDRLVRGKETLVRLYFSTPSCAATDASIQITGARLDVSGAGTVLASG